MNAFAHFIVAHSNALEWLITAAVTSMPAPGVDGAPDSWLYRWFFGFTHIGVGSVARARVGIKIKNGGENGSANIS